MKQIIIAFTTIFLFFSCNGNPKSEENKLYVKNETALKKAIEHVKAGDEIILANGIWTNIKIDFYGHGNKDSPIILRAETPGKVFIEGESYLHLGGEYLIIKDLYFKNGYSPSSSIIRYKIGEDKTAFNTRVTNCAIENFTKPSRLTNDKWIEFYGKHNTLENCYITGKSNDGETLRVFQDGNEHSSNYHQIVNNYFGPRPRKGGPRGETIRIGDSKTSMTSGFVNVSNNYFEACNGEVEIISDKTNFNTFRNNIFYKSEGSLVLRHGSFSTVDSNIFIGGEDSDFYGGIRLVSTGHWITNNYFYKIKGEQFRSPLAVMNGIPMSSLNRYKQVTDVVIAYNTWIDCKSPWQLGVGQNLKSVNVLPPSEIRSAPPVRSIIANNIIFNHNPDKTPVFNHDNIDGIQFNNNILDNDGNSFSEKKLLKNKTIKMKQINTWLFAPENAQAALTDSIYYGYDFDKIKTDLFGSSRTNQNSIGAICNISAAEKFIIDKKKYGPQWFSVESKKAESNIIEATQTNLLQKIEQAKSGDIIELVDEAYTFSNPIIINKKIIIRSKNKTKLIFNSTKNQPAFEMHPYGFLYLDNIILTGKNNQSAFKPLDENMSAAYNLDINNSTIEGFGYILKATKGSFSDYITFSNSTIQNCNNGIILAAEEKGDYNAEMLTITNCNFNNVKNNVIHFFRGGYDESTIGGVLTVSNSSFTNCSENEKTKVLLKTKGIINVDLSHNRFENNPVDYIAILWGEKNNKHQENALTNSGKIKVEAQQKLEILY
ncbi:chondroitinase-B domain-containing protein [Algibacter sp. L1A34]|uniref:chondroitinase-B domain-containing protein n=1 Tax=Algibacter sp. L1A34 TaxID=2686365 RepID=UPI00131DFEFD|nr:chondroitinase-B domain-containing protein [Algibacter sp. L1A34]